MTFLWPSAHESTSRHRFLIGECPRPCPFREAVYLRVWCLPTDFLPDRLLISFLQVPKRMCEPFFEQKRIWKASRSVVTRQFGLSSRENWTEFG